MLIYHWFSMYVENETSALKTFPSNNMKTSKRGKISRVKCRIQHCSQFPNKRIITDTLYRQKWVDIVCFFLANSLITSLYVHKNKHTAMHRHLEQNGDFSVPVWQFTQLSIWLNSVFAMVEGSLIQEQLHFSISQLLQATKKTALIYSRTTKVPWPMVFVSCSK